MDISWTDHIRALIPSIPCFSSSRPSSSRRETSNPDLAALLQSTSSSESDFDALSLHSTHRPHVRRTNKARGQGITFCGLQVFGKRTGAIALPDDEDDNATHGEQQPESPSTTSTPVPRSRTSSGAGYDSDPAPLDASALSLTELQDRVAKEERKKARRAEKAAKKEELRRIREARNAAQQKHSLAEDGEFEGFQGSGPIVPSPQSQVSFQPEPQSLRPSPTSPHSTDFVYLQDTAYMDDPADDDADLDGAIYSRPSTSHLGDGGSSSGGRSSSRLSSSAYSASSPGYGLPRHGTHAQLSPTQPMLPPPKPKKRKRKTEGSRSSTTSSTLADPLSPTADAFPSKIVHEEFEGY